MNAAKSSKNQAKCMGLKRLSLFALFAVQRIGILIPMNDTEDYLRNEVSRAEGDVEAAAYELLQKENEAEQTKEALSKYLSEVDT